MQSNSRESIRFSGQIWGNHHKIKGKGSLEGGDSEYGTSPWNKSERIIRRRGTVNVGTSSWNNSERVIRRRGTMNVPAML